MSEVHSILFNKNIWTLKDSKRWLKEHDYIPIKKVDITTNFYRFRIRDPKLFKKFRIIYIDYGIEFVLGFK